MSPPRRSPLFPAVVLAGVALTAAAACGSETSSPADGGGTSDATPRGDAASTGDAASGDAASSDAAAISDACLPDAEIPVPPCVLIK